MELTAQDTEKLAEKLAEKSTKKTTEKLSLLMYGVNFRMYNG